MTFTRIPHGDYKGMCGGSTWSGGTRLSGNPKLWDYRLLIGCSEMSCLRCGFMLFQFQGSVLPVGYITQDSWLHKTLVIFEFWVRGRPNFLTI